MSNGTKAAPKPVRITIEGEGGPYVVALKGDDLDPQRLEAAREIAACCSGIAVRSLHPGASMVGMVRHELAATLKRLADLG